MGEIVLCWKQRRAFPIEKGEKAVQIKTAIANKQNYGNKRSTGGIQYIVLHYTANDGDSDESNGRYFQNHIVEASAHYFVDGDSVTQSVPDEFVAWSVGGKKYPSCATSGGGKWYGKCTNNNSISVELCDEVRNGKYDFSEKTLRNAVELVRMLMKKYNVPIQNVIRHFDVVGKICPKPFVDDTKAWENFKKRLTGEQKKEEEEMIKYYETLAEVPTWAKPIVQDMIRKGCFADKNKLHLSEDMIRTMALMQRYQK